MCVLKVYTIRTITKYFNKTSMKNFYVRIFDLAVFFLNHRIKLLVSWSLMEKYLEFLLDHAHLQTCWILTVHNFKRARFQICTFKSCWISNLHNQNLTWFKMCIIKVMVDSHFLHLKSSWMQNVHIRYPSVLKMCTSLVCTF